MLLTLVAHAVEGQSADRADWSAGPAAERTTALYAAASWCLVAVVLVLGDRRPWWPRPVSGAELPAGSGLPGRAAVGSRRPIAATGAEA